jgi:hypothetical protein
MRGQIDENALILTFLIFQVIARMNLEQVAECYMSAFDRLLEIAGPRRCGF